MITNYAKKLLENKQYAIGFAALFSVIPFVSWLSVALVALVTLRKGAKPGFEVMLPALVIHSAPLMWLVSPSSAFTNALISYVPCYFAALVLRKTMNWQMVFSVFFTQALLGFLFIQLLAPDFAINQFAQFEKIVAQYQPYQEAFASGTEGMSTFVLAQLFLGIQILSVIVSAVISLVFARSTQAKLFMPGGFGNELMAFRSGRLALLVLIVVSFGTYYDVSYAINLLPLVFCYFLLSGFGLTYFIFAGKQHVKIAILLLLLMVLKPFFVVLAYVVFGSLDSLFNFRLYLSTQVRESI